MTDHETRYKDAYAIASSTSTNGQVIKFFALVVGVGGSAYGVSLGGMHAVGMTMAAVVLGGLLYITGVLTAAAGQLLLAVVDTAVHTGKLLNQTKARSTSVATSTAVDESSSSPSATVVSGCWFCGSPDAVRQFSGHPACADCLAKAEGSAA